MPTFFSRKYMRGKPKRTERLVGAFVLGLLAFIVAAFLLTGGLFAGLVNRSPKLKAAKDFFGISERPLFVAAPENMKPPPASHEMRVAEAMLPVLPAPWKRTELEIIDVSKLTRGLTISINGLGQGPLAAVEEAIFKASIPEYDAVAAWRGVYEDGSRKVVILIADAGTPEAAFGMVNSMRLIRTAPDSGAVMDPVKLPIGRGGRLDRLGNTARFWAGRYSTAVIGWFPFDGTQEKAATAPAEGGDSSAAAPPQRVESTVEQVARAAAALQINYGGPFWAESVLPAEGRVEDSLRYTRKTAMGMEELTDLWTASYPAEVVLGVMQPKSPDAVLAALRKRFEKAATEPGSGAEASEAEPYGSEEGEGEDPAGKPSEPAADLMAVLGQDIAAGTHGDKRIVAYAAGPYVFVATGKQMEPILALAKSTRERWAGGATQIISSSGPGEAQAKGQARFAEVEGGEVQTPAKVERFTDNLYEKIDGREGQFRAFGFVELRFGQYQNIRRQQAFDVYIYDMGEPNNAMGIYMAEKSEGAEPLPLGQEGYLSGPNAYFYKGKYYVNVLGPSEGDDAAAETARQIAAAIADTIADIGVKLWADELLPKEGRIESLRFQPTSALAHDFLDRFFFAKYKIGGSSLEMFIHKAPGQSEATKLFKKYAEEAPKYETLVSREKTDGGETIVTESMGAYTVAFHKGPYFAGVTNCKDRELAVSQASALRDRLNANDPGEPAPPETGESRQEPSPEGGGEDVY